MSIIGRLRPYSIVVFVLGPRLGHFSFPDTVATEDSTVDSFLKCPPSSDLFHFHWSDIGWPKQESVILPCVQWERELEYLWVAVFSNRASPVCWAAVYGVAQSWTRLMQLSSSSSRSNSVVKNLPAMQESQETRVLCLGQEDPWRRKWQPTQVFLPEKSHGQRSLAGYSPEGCKESYTAEHRAHCIIHEHLYQ